MYNEHKREPRIYLYKWFSCENEIIQNQTERTLRLEIGWNPRKEEHEHIHEEHSEVIETKSREQNQNELLCLEPSRVKSVQETRDVIRFSVESVFDWTTRVRIGRMRVKEAVEGGGKDFSRVSVSRPIESSLCTLCSQVKEWGRGKEGKKKESKRHEGCQLRAWQVLAKSKLHFAYTIPWSHTEKIQDSFYDSRPENKVIIEIHKTYLMLMLQHH